MLSIERFVFADLWYYRGRSYGLDLRLGKTGILQGISLVLPLIDTKFLTVALSCLDIDF